MSRNSFPLKYSPLLKANALCDFEDVILVEEKGRLGLYPLLILPFDPSILLGCGSLYTSNLMLCQKDRKYLIVDAIIERQSLFLSLCVYHGNFLCDIYAKFFMSHIKDPWIHF